jgi:hypothetical protein
MTKSAIFVVQETGLFPEHLKPRTHFASVQAASKIFSRNCQSQQKSMPRDQPGACLTIV